MMLWVVMLVTALEKPTAPLEQKENAGYSHCTLRRERGAVYYSNSIETVAVILIHL